MNNMCRALHQKAIENVQHIMASVISTRPAGPAISARTARNPANGRGTLLARTALTAERASLDIGKMSPIHDRVLIRPFEEEKKTAAGILLPKGPPKGNSDAHIGEVVAMGEEVELDIKPGDKVVFQKYATAEVEVKDGNVLFVAQKSIMAKLE